MSSNMAMDLEHQFFQEEEDVFYEELRKRMLHLTEDDDEVDDDYFITERQGSKRSMAKAIKPVGNYYNWWEIQNGNSTPTPTWIVNLWRNNGNGVITGTGVFIPQIVISSRKLKSGKKNNNGRRRIYKQVGNN